MKKELFLIHGLGLFWPLFALLSNKHFKAFSIKFGYVTKGLKRLQNMIQNVNNLLEISSLSLTKAYLKAVRYIIKLAVNIIYSISYTDYKKLIFFRKKPRVKPCGQRCAPILTSWRRITSAFLIGTLPISRYKKFLCSPNKPC